MYPPKWPVNFPKISLVHAIRCFRNFHHSIKGSILANDNISEYSHNNPNRQQVNLVFMEHAPGTDLQDSSEHKRRDTCPQEAVGILCLQQHCTKPSAPACLVLNSAAGTHVTPFSTRENESTATCSGPELSRARMRWVAQPGTEIDLVPTRFSLASSLPCTFFTLTHLSFIPELQT